MNRKQFLAISLVLLFGVGVFPFTFLLPETQATSSYPTGTSAPTVDPFSDYNFNETYPRVDERNPQTVTSYTCNTHGSLSGGGLYNLIASDDNRMSFKAWRYYWSAIGDTEYILEAELTIPIPSGYSDTSYLIVEGYYSHKPASIQLWDGSSWVTLYSLTSSEASYNNSVSSSYIISGEIKVRVYMHTWTYSSNDFTDAYAHLDRLYIQTKFSDGYVTDIYAEDFSNVAEWAGSSISTDNYIATVSGSVYVVPGVSTSSTPFVEVRVSEVSSSFTLKVQVSGTNYTVFNTLTDTGVYRANVKELTSSGTIDKIYLDGDFKIDYLRFYSIANYNAYYWTNIGRESYLYHDEDGLHFTYKWDTSGEEGIGLYQNGLSFTANYVTVGYEHLDSLSMFVLTLYDGSWHDYVIYHSHGDSGRQTFDISSLGTITDVRFRIQKYGTEDNQFHWFRLKYITFSVDEIEVNGATVTGSSGKQITSGDYMRIGDTITFSNINLQWADATDVTNGGYYITKNGNVDWGQNYNYYTLYSEYFNSSQVDYGNDYGQNIVSYDFETGYGTEAVDRSGYGNNGIIHGATWNSTTSAFGDYSMYFDGSSYVEIESNSVLDTTKQAGLTIAIWARPESDSAGNYKILIGRQGHHMAIFQMNNYYRFDVWNESGTCFKVYDSSATFSTGDWTFIVGYVDYTNDVIGIYINGTLVDSKQFNGLSYSYTSDWFIGGWGSYYYTGNLDNIQIWNTALNSYQIQELYARGLQTFRDNDVWQREPIFESFQDVSDWSIYQASISTDGDIATIQGTVDSYNDYAYTSTNILTTEYPFMDIFITDTNTTTGWTIKLHTSAGNTYTAIADTTSTGVFHVNVKQLTGGEIVDKIYIYVKYDYSYVKVDYIRFYGFNGFSYGTVNEKEDVAYVDEEGNLAISPGSSSWYMKYYPDSLIGSRFIFGDVNSYGYYIQIKAGGEWNYGVSNETTFDDIEEIRLYSNSGGASTPRKYAWFKLQIPYIPDGESITTPVEPDNVTYSIHPAWTGDNRYRFFVLGDSWSIDIIGTNVSLSFEYDWSRTSSGGYIGTYYQLAQAEWYNGNVVSNQPTITFWSNTTNKGYTTIETTGWLPYRQFWVSESSTATWVNIWANVSIGSFWQVVENRTLNLPETAESMKAMRLDFYNQKGELIPFDNFRVKIHHDFDNRDQWLYYNVFEMNEYSTIDIYVYDRWGQTVYTEADVPYTQFKSIQIASYSYKINNHQEDFVHINLTRDGTSQYWSEWLAPYETAEYFLQSDTYSLTVTYTNGTYSYYGGIPVSTDYYFLIEGNTIQDVLGNIAMVDAHLDVVNESISTQIYSVNLTVGNINSSISNQIVTVTLNLDNVNTTITTQLTDLNTLISNVNSSLSGEINNVYVEILTFNATIDEQTNNILLNITNQFSDVESQINVIEALVNNLDGDITAQTNNLTVQINNLKDNITLQFNDLGVTITNLNTTMLEQFNDIYLEIVNLNDTMLTQFISVTSDISNLQTNVTNQFIELTNTLLDVNSTIASQFISVTSDITNLQTNITSQFVDITNTLLDVNSSIASQFITVTNDISVLQTNVTNQFINLTNTLLDVNSTIASQFISVVNDISVLQGNITSQVVDLTNTLLDVNSTIASQFITVINDISDLNTTMLEQFVTVTNDITNVNSTMVSQFIDVVSDISNVNSTMLEQFVEMTNKLTNINGSIASQFVSVTNDLINLKTNVTNQFLDLTDNLQNVNSSITTQFISISNEISNLNTTILEQFVSVSTELNNLNTTMLNQFVNLSAYITNINSTIGAEFISVANDIYNLNTTMLNQFINVTNQITNLNSTMLSQFVTMSNDLSNINSTMLTQYLNIISHVNNLNSSMTSQFITVLTDIYNTNQTVLQTKLDLISKINWADANAVERAVEILTGQEQSKTEIQWTAILGVVATIASIVVSFYTIYRKIVKPYGPKVKKYLETRSIGELLARKKKTDPHKAVEEKLRRAEERRRRA